MIYHIRYFRDGAWHLHPKTFRLASNATSYAVANGYTEHEVVSEPQETSQPTKREMREPDDFSAIQILSMKDLTLAEAHHMLEQEDSGRRRLPVLRFLRKTVERLSE